jgi:integrase
VLLTELGAAKNRQAAEKLALGEAYTDQGYVVCNEAGEPYHPSTLSTLWQAAIRDLDVPLIRLHDARHTCATLMHLQGVPIALVAAWLGHADVSFTLRTYVHAQPDALSVAARSFPPAPISAAD